MDMGMALAISSSSARRLMFLEHHAASTHHHRFLIPPIIFCFFFFVAIFLFFLLRLLLPRTIFVFLRHRPLPTSGVLLLLPPQHFRYGDLKSCTSGFSDARKIGQGASGVVYRGFLRRTRQEIAVKRLLGGPAEMELQNEIRILSHVNNAVLLAVPPPSPPPTVALLGYCRHGDERLLVYEYMPHHSLQEALFDKTRPSWPMRWETRFKVVIDTAQALAFLHSCHPAAIIHGDVKPSNILLDGNFRARIADFGLARFKAATEFATPPEPAASSDTTPSAANLSRRRRSSRSHSHKPKDKHKLQRMYMWPKIDASVADEKKKPPPWSAAAVIDPAPPIGSPCASSFFTASPEYSDAASSVLSKQTSEEAAASHGRSDAADGPRSDSETAGACAEEKVAVVMIYSNGATTSEDEDRRAGENAPAGRDSSADGGWWWKQAGSYGDTQPSLTAKEYVMEWIRKQEVDREPSPSSDSPTTSCSSCCAAIAAPDPPTAASIPAVAEPTTVHGRAELRRGTTESARVEEHWDECGPGGGAATLSRKRSGGGSRRGRSWRSASSASLEWWMQHSDDEEGRCGGGAAAEETGDDCGGGSKRGREGTVGRDCRKNAAGRRRSMSGGGADRMSGGGSRGTICYAAPEMGGSVGGEAAAAEEGRVVDEKSDVYSYGMLMLVVVSGRRPLQVSESAAISDVGRASLLSWARRLARSGGGDELELVDPALGGEFDERQASLCIQVALQCLQRRPATRPSMADVVAMLSGQTPPAPAPPSPAAAHRRRTCGPSRDGRFHTRHTSSVKSPHT